MGHRLLVRSAKQVVPVVANGERCLKGDAMRNVVVLDAGEGAHEGISLVVDHEGLIAAIGKDSDIANKYKGVQFDQTIDAHGQCVIPGLIDGHTHAVWSGDRVHEFAMKLAGATYMEVHQAGGGIHFTVDHVRRATEEQLYAVLRDNVRRALQAGTTLMECKSGYGLDTESEMKMLRVIERAKKELPMEISSTFCGAHAVPKGSTPELATEDVLKNQLPKLQELMEAGTLAVDNIDAFCEQGCFDVEQTRAILQAGQRMGLSINFHGEELHQLGSAEMGAALGARAISHLEEVSDQGIAAMARAGTVATVLPTTAYILRLRPPPVRKMIDSGVVVALGSDLNPNAHCMAMPVVLHLACVLFHMSMPEALAAATINAAASLGRAATHGSLEAGKVGDFLVLDVPKWEHLIYQFGSYQHVISHVIKKGKVVHSKIK